MKVLHVVCPSGVAVVHRFPISLLLNILKSGGGLGQIYPPHVDSMVTTLLSIHYHTEVFFFFFPWNKVTPEGV